MKKNIWIAIACAVLAIGFGVAAYFLSKSNAEKKEFAASHLATEPPPPGSQPASAEFLAEIDAYVDLVKQIQHMKMKVQSTREWKEYQTASDRAAGMQVRLQQEIPPGWQFDSKSRMMIPPAAAPAPAAAVPPMPASPVAPLSKK